MSLRPKPYFSPEDYLVLERSLRLDAIDCELALAEIYDKVEFPGAP